MTKIDAKYLTKVYKNGAYALKNCSLSVNDGEFLVILGASGAGKSTLLKILAGTEPLSSGELYLDGILAENVPTSKRNASMVFQEYVLYPHMTVFDNLATPLRLEGVDEKTIYERVMEALRIFNLELCADVKPRNLSGGEQQRVSLAKALLKRSKLVLLDEPMSNVDEKSRWEYCRILKKLKQMLPDSTFIYVTHNVKEALLLADRIAVMQDGAVLEIANTDLLVSRPQHRDTAELMGIALDDSHRFDSQGKRVGLSSVEVSFDGELHGDTLEFADKVIKLDEEYLSRLLHRPSEVIVTLSIDKFGKTLLSNGFFVVAEVLENCTDYAILKIKDESFILNKKTGLKSGEKIKLYYKIDDLTLYCGGERLTAHYPLKRRIDVKILDSAKGNVELLGKRVRVGKGISRTVGYALVTERAFELSYDKGKYSVPVYGCLDEEFINGKKLNHIALKGVDGYLSVISEQDLTCFGKSKVWININPSELTLEEGE